MGLEQLRSTLIEVVLTIVWGLWAKITDFIPFLKAPKVPYERKRDELIKSLKDRAGAAPMALTGKPNTNLFRIRNSDGEKRVRINVRNFNCVCSVNAKERTCYVEGMTTYEDLVAGTLPYGMMPTVVPELRSITIGGAISGVGIESSSFRYGFVHETILEMDVLLGDGTVVTCSPDNEHRDLFYGIPNSYGTLGYILRLKVRLVPVKKFVQVRHLRYNDINDALAEMERACNGSEDDDSEIDFVDGVVFGPDEAYVTVGRFVDTLPQSHCNQSKYDHVGIYYKSIQARNTDYLSTLDYIWRWDTDWFWCSRYFYAQWLPLRFILGLLGVLRSTAYMKVWRWYRNAGLYNEPREFVIQDVEIPIRNSAQFLDFFHSEIGISPVWMCPVKSYCQEKALYPLYKVSPGDLYVNFGFWDSVEHSRSSAQKNTNQKLEEKVDELKGKKSLYSESFYTPEAFWKNYNKKAYNELRDKYGATNAFLNLYDKCVKNK